MVDPSRITGSLTDRWGTWLAAPIDNCTLALFRIIFGILISVELIGSWSRRLEMITIRPIRFPYMGFEWVPLLPGWAAPVVYVVIILACLGVALGLFFRVTATVFAIGYTYTFLVDRAYFNNHFYLICLLASWLAVGDADRRWSLDAWRIPGRATTIVPRWQLLGLAIQMAIPYVLGGIAKIKPDWLRGEPMRAQLWELWDSPLYGSVVQQPWAGVTFAWAGMLFDLLIVPALLWHRTRWPALGAMLFFHITNMHMFDIGIFPWLGIGSAILFMPPSLVSRVASRFGCAGPRDVSSVRTATPCSPLVTWGFAMWFGIQAVLPFRHYLIPGNVGWTREGFYFAWTMKLDLKSEFLGFHLCDPETGACRAVSHDGMLTSVQRYWLPGEPQGIVIYAKFLRDRALKQGMRDPVVVCDSVCALNGRPYQYMIDPALDPAELSVPRFGRADWIVPLDEHAPTGNYKIGSQKENAVMAVIHRTRIERGIFPARLRGLKITDGTDSKAVPK